MASRVGSSTSGAGPVSPEPDHRFGHGKAAAEVDRTSIREVAALHRFEVFLFTAIGTVLVVRAFLAVTGYPKIGSGGLHVAHVLWGGLLLAVAVVLGLAGLGSRIRTWAAFLGGIGFGLFIDEVGKFLTADVNYFYTPAVAIMYVVFVVFYLVVREILLRRRLTDRRRLALAATAIIDQALGQLDERNRDDAVRLLDGTAQPTPLVATLRVALLEQPVARRAFQQWLDAQRARGAAVLRRVVTNPLVQLAVFALLVYGVIHRIADYVDYLRLTLDLQRLADEVNALPGLEGSGDVHLGIGFYFWYLIVANLVCATIAGIGLVLCLPRRPRRSGLRVLAFALLLDLLFNQFSAFKYSQFGALVGFAVELTILLGIRSLLRTGDAPAPLRQIRDRLRPPHSAASATR